MPMGYGSNYCDTVEESFVKSVAPDEFADFMKTFETAVKKGEDEPQDINEFATEARTDDFVDAPKERVDKYNALCEAFKKKTGLSLSLDFHDADSDGSCYDDVNGIAWCVGNVYEYTAAGQKYSEHITRKQFVTFG